VKKMTYGDFREWSTAVLHESLTKVIYAKQNRIRPYYIMVIIKKGYFGPPSNPTNDLIATEAEKTQAAKTGQKQMDKNFEGKTMLSCRILILETPPPVAQIGSGVWFIDNLKGIVKCLYLLPPDTPVDSNRPLDDEESILVARSAKRLDSPIFYNKN